MVFIVVGPPKLPKPIDAGAGIAAFSLVAGAGVGVGGGFAPPKGNPPFGATGGFSDVVAPPNPPKPPVLRVGADALKPPAAGVAPNPPAADVPPKPPVVGAAELVPNANVVVPPA